MNPKSDFSPQFKSAEAQRLYYLQIMGISTYYPGFVLPGARLSQACELPELMPAGLLDDSQPPEVSDNVGSAQSAQPSVPSLSGVAPGDAGSPAGVTVRGRMRIALDEVDSGASAVSKLADSKTAEAAVPAPSNSAVLDGQSGSAVASGKDISEDSENLQFQTVLVLAENGLALCVQIPALSNSVLSERELRLMHNILHWLKSPVRRDLVMRSFNWPLPGIAEQSAEMAAKSLSGFLQQSRHELGFKTLLVMGSSLHAVTERMNALSATLPWQQINTHSLAEMLAIPELKRSCWQQLITLQAHLSEAADQQ